MEELCGKSKEGKYYCKACIRPDPYFRDIHNYKVHINSKEHKLKCGLPIEEKKTKTELLQERNAELEERVKYLEGKLEKALAENKELKLEKEIENRIRKEQPKQIQLTQPVIPHNEVIEPDKKPKKSKEGNPEKYLEETYKNPKNIFREIEMYITNNDDGTISEIVSNVSCKDSIKPEIIQLVEYCKGSLFYINNKHYYFAFNYKKWVDCEVEMSIVIPKFIPLIEHLIVLHRDTYGSRLNKKEIIEDILIPQTKKLWCL